MDSMISGGRRKRRPNFAVTFKRQLAQQACEPGVSVSQLAQQRGLNVNMLFKSRRHWVAGLFNASPTPHAKLPGKIVEASASVASTPMPHPLALSDSTSKVGTGVVRQGHFEIVIADAMVRFDGHADPDTLRQSIAWFERVIRTWQPYIMALLRYDIARSSNEGAFESRYWSINHKPIIGDHGEV